MCPPLLKTCSGVIAQFNVRRQRLTPVAFSCVLTQDCETSEEYSYDSEQSLASEASENSVHSANEELFLAYAVRTDVRRFQLISL